MGAIHSVAVLGAGHGGAAVAADLTLRGYEVRLHSRTAERLEPLRAGVTLTGVRQGTATPARITTDLAAAVRGADLVLLVVPAVAHESYARALAPLLTPGSTVMLNPGHTGGSLDFATALAGAGGRVGAVCESVTLTFICRMEGPATVGVYRETTRLRFAALPARRTAELHLRLTPLFPNLVPAENVLETGLMNINAVIHPPGMLMNAGWIEFTGGRALFYRESITPAVARVIEAVDAERLALAERLGLTLPAFIDYFCAAGLTTEGARATRSVYRAMRESEANRTIRAPSSLDHRYVHEDVGFGLVPMTALAGLVGLPTPAMESLITLASVARGRDYRREGLTLERMGLAGLSPEALRRQVTEGREAAVTTSSPCLPSGVAPPTGSRPGGA
jgi:opine dehydrogenase